MNKGAIKIFNAGNRFGFINDSEPDEAYSVPSSGLTETIGKNDTVTFELKQVKKGLIEFNVKLT